MGGLFPPGDSMIVVFRQHSTLASYLLMPYALWVAFATALNATLFRLNP